MRVLSPWTAAAVVFAVAIPAVLVWSTRPPHPDVVRPGETVIPSAVPPANIAARSLFLPPIDPARLPEVEGAPRLIGIAGRLPDKAVAMVRASDGTTRVLSPGQAHEGWTLESLSPDAALFTRGGRRVRSFLPAPEAQAPDEGEEGEGEGL